MKNKAKLSIAEWIIYIGFGLLSLWGIVYIIFGCTCNFVNYKSALAGTDTYLRQTSGGMGFLEQGILILVCGLLVIVTTLLITSKKSDREFEKTQRRAARISQRKNPVADAEVSEIPSEK